MIIPRHLEAQDVIIHCLPVQFLRFAFQYAKSDAWNRQHRTLGIFIFDVPDEQWTGCSIRLIDTVKLKILI